MEPRKIIGWAIAAIVVFAVVSYIVKVVFIDTAIAEAHEATGQAQAQLATEKQRNVELSEKYEPQIDELKDKVTALEIDNAVKQQRVLEEQRNRVAAQRRARDAEEARIKAVATITSSSDVQLAAHTLNMININYPQVTGTRYGVFGKDFVANRPAAEGIALGFNEVVSNRIIIGQKDTEIESLEIQTNEIAGQKLNLEVALGAETEAHGLTRELLVSEQGVSEKNLTTLEAQMKEIEAYERKWKFDIFAPKCGIGGFVGYDLANGKAAVGPALFCGWIFP